jgi:hypothetical protein
MRVGSIVKNIYTDEIFIIIEQCTVTGFCVVSGGWQMPEEQLEVICE